MILIGTDCIWPVLLVITGFALGLSLVYLIPMTRLSRLHRHGRPTPVMVSLLIAWLCGFPLPKDPLAPRSYATSTGDNLRLATRHLPRSPQRITHKPHLFASFWLDARRHCPVMGTIRQHVLSQGCLSTGLTAPLLNQDFLIERSSIYIAPPAPFSRSRPFNSFISCHLQHGTPLVLFAWTLVKLGIGIINQGHRSRLPGLRQSDLTFWISQGPVSRLSRVLGKPT